MPAQAKNGLRSASVPGVRSGEPKRGGVAGCGGRREGWGASREASREEVALLRVISEQNAMRIDQIARLVGVYLADAVRIVEELRGKGWVEMEPLIASDPAWVWLRGGGDEVAGTGYVSLPPRIWGLVHWEAINEARLYLAERVPQGRWVCERELRREQGGKPKGHLPDAALEIGNERHAIEVELSKKPLIDLQQIIAEHQSSYEAVVYFCSPQVRRWFESLGMPKAYPDLVILSVSEAERRLRREEWRVQGTAEVDGRRADDEFEPWEVRVLELVVEQGAIPMDQLRRFLGCGVEAAERVVVHLLRGGVVRRAQPLADEEDWIWATAKGARLAALGVRAGDPRLGGLQRRRAMNEIRLYLAERAPGAHWIGKRELLYGRVGSRSVPDAVVEIDGERHAIEVVLSRQDQPVLERKASVRSAEYDAVIWFYARRGHGAVERFAKKGRFPKLVVRALPNEKGAKGRRRGPGSARQAPSGEVWKRLAKARPAVVYPIVPEAAFAEGLEVIAMAAGIDREPQVIRVWRRVGQGPRMECVQTDVGTYRVVYTSWGWRADEVEREDVFVKKDVPPVDPSVSSLWPKRVSAVVEPERYEVDDEVWAEVGPLIPPVQERRSARSRQSVSDRAVLSGLVLRLRRGGGWGGLVVPTSLGYGSASSQRVRLREWREMGVWDGVRDVLRARLVDGGELDWGWLSG